MKDKRFLGFFFLGITAFIFGFYGLLVRLVGYNIPVFYGAFMRNTLLTLILFIFVLALGKWKKVYKKDFIWVIVRSSFGILGFFGSFIPLQHMSFANFYFVCYAGMPIGGYLLGVIFFKEKITGVKLFSLVLAIIGLFLIYTFNFDQTKFIYLLLSFAGGIGTAGWNVVSKKISHSYPALQLNFLDSLVFTFFALAFSLVLAERWVKPEVNTVWLAALAMVAMFLITGQFIVYGFKLIEASTGSIIMLLEIVFGILVGFWFYQETVSLTALLGGGLIILAIVLPEIVSKRIKLYKSSFSR